MNASKLALVKDGKVARRQGKRNILAALDAFEPANDHDGVGTCGNIKSLFDPEYDVKTGKYKGGIFNNKPFYEAVDAPYLLAKLVAGYRGLNVNAEGQEAYKVTWMVVLRHKETGAIVTFYDWKGGSSFGSDIMPALAESVGYRSFKVDLTNLLKALTHKNFPHPYDGCSIGEIA